MPNDTKSKVYVCTEAFAATLSDGDHWYKVGQRVSVKDEVFAGQSGENRMKRLFVPAEEAV